MKTPPPTNESDCAALGHEQRKGDEDTLILCSIVLFVREYICLICKNTRKDRGEGYNPRTVCP